MQPGLQASIPRCRGTTTRPRPSTSGPSAAACRCIGPPVNPWLLHRSPGAPQHRGQQHHLGSSLGHIHRRPCLADPPLGPARAAAGPAPPASASTNEPSTSVSSPAPAASSQPQPEQTAASSSQHWFDQLTETQRYVLADEWGFSLVGTSLPPGVSTRVLASAIPPECQQPDLTRALIGVALPTAVIALAYGSLWYMHSITPWWQWLVCWLAIGTAYAGLFQVAHECSRGAYMPQYPKTQDLLGAILMAPALFNLDAWRVQIFQHAFTLNQLGADETAWHPVTVADVASASPARRLYLRLITSTPLKLLSSIGGWCKSLQRWDLFSYYEELRERIVNGWVGPAVWLGLAVPVIMTLTGGMSGLFNYWVAPLLVFHFWLSTLTLTQHTAPHIPWQRPGEEDLARAVVNGTVTLQLPRWLEVLLNYPNYHVPQHVIFDGVPCYHAKKATEALRERLWPYMQEAWLSVKLLTNHITKWQVYNPESQQYITFDEALTLIEQAERSEAIEELTEAELALAAQTS